MFKVLKAVIIKRLLICSVKHSMTERNGDVLKKTIANIVPSLVSQYSTFNIDMSDEYIVEKIRSQHAFQTSIAMKAIDLTAVGKDKATVVDIGDSAGTHIQYLTELYKEKAIELNALSVNLDNKAVEKIKAKGMNAICCRAEELHIKENISADVFLSFEMLEHLFNPIAFLHSMATSAKCEYFVITVPYVVKSRVGLGFIRNNDMSEKYAENVHIFELCPEDWDLIFKFSGWEIVHSDRYTQYPSSGLLNLMKYHWRKYDFDGFYGVILKKNLTLSKLYKDW